jgi:hypothetical protein
MLKLVVEARPVHPLEGLVLLAVTDHRPTATGADQPILSFSGQGAILTLRDPRPRSERTLGKLRRQQRATPRVGSGIPRLHGRVFGCRAHNAAEVRRQTGRTFVIASQARPANLTDARTVRFAMGGLSSPQILSFANVHICNSGCPTRPTTPRISPSVSWSVFRNTPCAPVSRAGSR